MKDKILKGYYIKARIIQESEIAHAPPHIREVWDWLIKEANHKDNKKSGKVIKRGQCVRSYKDIRNGLSWKVGYRVERYPMHHIQTAMKWLTKRGMITTMKTTRGTMITVCNYEKYQNPKNYENSTRTRPRTRMELHDKQECKNDKNVKEYIICGEFQNVKLTKEELEKLKTNFFDYNERIENLSHYIESSGKRYKSHYATILNWSRKDKKDAEIKPKTYAQAQDAERRIMVRTLKEMQNDGNTESDSRGVNETPHLLSHGKEVNGGN